MQLRIPIKLRELGQSGKRRLFVIPFIFTFANACMGLLAVLYAWDDYYRTAAICILFAALFDSLDGRLARMFNSCSSLGMELDSLCDAISFCFAPAIVIYGNFFAEHSILGMIAVGFFLCAGLFRLAKFNNTSCQQKHFFIGMSTPVSAVFFALLIIHQARLADTYMKFVYDPYILMSLVACFAYLMVSRIRFPTFKGGIASHRLNLSAGVAMVLTALGGHLCGYPIFLSGLSAYILIVVVYHIIKADRLVA